MAQSSYHMSMTVMMTQDGFHMDCCSDVQKTSYWNFLLVESPEAAERLFSQNFDWPSIDQVLTWSVKKITNQYSQIDVLFIWSIETE